MPAAFYLRPASFAPVITYSTSSGLQCSRPVQTLSTMLTQQQSRPYYEHHVARGYQAVQTLARL